MRARIDTNRSYLDEAKDSIESTIDKAGLETTLSLIETICMQKAEHIDSNGQNRFLAQQWENDADDVSKIISRWNKTYRIRTHNV